MPCNVAVFFQTRHLLSMRRDLSMFCVEMHDYTMQDFTCCYKKELQLHVSQSPIDDSDDSHFFPIDFEAGALSLTKHSM